MFQHFNNTALLRMDVCGKATTFALLLIIFLVNLGGSSCTDFRAFWLSLGRGYLLFKVLTDL